MSKWFQFTLRGGGEGSRFPPRSATALGVQLTKMSCLGCKFATTSVGWVPRGAELTGSEVEDGVSSDVVDGEPRESVVALRREERHGVECVDTVVHQRVRLDERQRAGRQLHRTVSTLRATSGTVPYNDKKIFTSRVVAEKEEKQQLINK